MRTQSSLCSGLWCPLLTNTEVISNHWFQSGCISSQSPKWLLLSGQGDVPHWGVGSHRSPLSLYWVWEENTFEWCQLDIVKAALIQEAPNQLKPQHWAVLKKERKKEMREKEETRRFWSSFKAVSSLSPVRLDPTADWLILLIEKRHDCQTLLHHS